MLRIQEKILLHQAQKGDQSAFAKLYDEYIEQIQRFVFFKVSDQDKAEEITNTIFVKILNYLLKGDEIDNFRALLYKIARTTIIDFYRSKKDETVSLDEKIGLEKNLSVDPSQQIDQNFKLEIIFSSMKKLSADQQELITLRFVNELSFKEISKITGEKEGTLRVNVHRALEELKKMVSESEK